MSAGRSHIVMIPGFGGFDALGQMEYYAGVTPLFRRWAEERHRPGVVLHYFDNFPTAGVSTRAGRLRSYLAKRIARGEIVPGEDALMLVGHSTGGLDIRRLLWDLAEAPDEEIPVDGGRDAAFAVRAGQILGLVRRVVFLSVPQWGTNIADWVPDHETVRKLVVADLRAAVAGSQAPLIDTLESWLAKFAVCLSGVDLVWAVEDALREANAACGGAGNPGRTADAQEAAAHLELWLRHMASDFSALDDLSAHNPQHDAESPAHFDAATRKREVARWGAIETRSFATLGTRPFPFEAGPAPVWETWKPCTYPELARDAVLSAGTDITYRICYRACAGGRFNHKLPAGLEMWDNDGIVNTASMFWPSGRETVLVRCDHMDIVGHYKLVKATPGNGREYQAYDLLGSASGFGDAEFESVWTGIFDFCVQSTG